MFSQKNHWFIRHQPLMRRSFILPVALLLISLWVSLATQPAQAAGDTFNCPGARGGLDSAPIQGIKWHDANGNQRQDSDEAGLPGLVGCQRRPAGSLPVGRRVRTAQRQVGVGRQTVRRA